jgi:hypothetical protein
MLLPATRTSSVEEEMAQHVEEGEGRCGMEEEEEFAARKKHGRSTTRAK